MAKPQPSPSKGPIDAPSPGATELLETPTDDPAPKRRRKPSARKGMTSRLLGEGGDVVIYEAAQEGDERFPKGTLLPLPNMPQFKTPIEAYRWIIGDGGAVLGGKQLLIVKVHEMVHLKVQTKTVVDVVRREKQKIPTAMVEKAS